MCVSFFFSYPLLRGRGHLSQVAHAILRYYMCLSVRTLLRDSAGIPFFVVFPCSFLPIAVSPIEQLQERLLVCRDTPVYCTTTQGESILSSTADVTAA